ncbi:hypothetical protein D3C78_1338090 [compost metagenome]
MHLIDHYIFNIFKQLHPFRMMGQNSRMKHVRIRYHDMARISNSRSHSGRSISVIGMRLNACIHQISKLLQLSNLILRERLRRE